MNINWFPGHMAKATREIKEKLNLVDMVIELCDARAPIASINPVVKELVNNKYYLKVMTKIDLADEKESLIYKSEFEKKGIPCVFVNLNNKDSIKPITSKIKEVARPIIEKDLKRGLKPRNIRVMIVGIPNVGKSTLINLLAKRKSAPVGNMPGFTKAQKWVHCDGFDLLDTPGILWPNLTENNSGIKLALIGCIKEDMISGTTFSFGKPYRTMKDGVESSGAIFNDDGSVSLDHRNPTGGNGWSSGYAKTLDNSYIAFSGNYGVGTYIDFTFKGNNMPQVCLFANVINGKITGAESADDTTNEYK